MTARIVACAIALVAGIVAATYSPQPVPALALVATGATGLIATVLIIRAERRWKERPVYAVVLAAFLCGFPLGYLRTQQQLGSPPENSLPRVLSELPDGAAIGIRGTVCAEPEPRGNRRSDLRVRVTEIQTDDAGWRTVDPGTVLVQTYTVEGSGAEDVARLRRLADPEAYGFRIEAHARHGRADPQKNPGEFSFSGFLRQNDLLAWLRCHAGRVEILEETRGNPVVEVALWAKRSFLTTYKRTIRSPASRLVAAATLGTRRALDGVAYEGKDITESFRHAGIGHILAVSGLHVSIVALLFYGIFRLAGLRPKVLAPLVIALLILFAILTGARPSSVRSVIMSATTIVLFVYFRCNLRKATAIGLAVSAAVILLRSPVVLYSPGFLLSYGAVLSLVILVPPVDRLLCSQRGFSLLFLLAWSVLVMVIAGRCMQFLLDFWNWVGLVGLLAVFLQAGGRLNERFPAAWQIGLVRLPAPLRYFLGAQVAIQVGMMVPLSAWFFGQFPVAGAVVNLLAIPAVGVLVQLGMLTGMLGLVPLAGDYLALPFGAADSLVGTLFLRLAHMATLWFPFPATPKPGPVWMLGYYAVLLLLVVLVRRRARLQAAWYRAAVFFRRHACGRRLVALLPFFLAGILLKNLYPARERVHSVTCLAAGPYPVLAAVSSQGSVVTVNGGDRLTGERLLFEAIRHEGGTSVDTAILGGPQPQSGYEGLVALSRRLPIGRVLLPVVVDDPADFLAALGDPYLLNRAAEGDPWATRYREAYAELQRALPGRGTSLEPLHPGVLTRWDDFEVRRLRLPDRWPRRFLTSARTALLELNMRDWRWLVVTESLPETVDVVLEPGRAYDVLVLPDLSSRASYRALIDRLAERTTPRLVVFCGNRIPPGLDIEGWASQHGNPWILMTARDGAVRASVRSGRLVFQTWLTGKRISLPAGE